MLCLTFWSRKIMLKAIFSRIPTLTASTSKLSTLCRPKPAVPYQQTAGGTYSPVHEQNSSLLEKCLVDCRSRIQIRTKAIFRYRYNAYRRIMKYGLEKRLSSKSQREILCRRFVKGRWTLTCFDRLTNKFPEVKDPNQKRVQLMDYKKGYRSKVKKPEFYQFHND